MPLPSYSVEIALTRWRFDSTIATTLAVVAICYAAAFVLARRHGADLPWWRLAAFLVLGIGGTVVCTMSSLAVYQHAALWALAAQMTLLITIIPVCLAAGAPIDVLRGLGGPRWRNGCDRVLSGWLVRVLTFPVVAAVLGAIVQMYFYFGPLLGSALRSRTTMDATYLLMVTVGCLLALPLLGVDLLPSWCTEPFRLMFAALDGLLDAIPGIAVMTTGTLLAAGYYHTRYVSTSQALWGEHVAGAAVLALSEVIGLPLLVMLFLKWASSEIRQPAPGDLVAGDAVRPESADAASIPLDRPWWETEAGPRRTDEYRGRN